MRLKIDWASLISGRKFTVSLCFTLNLRAISKYKPPGGLIFGGAYTWKDLFWEFYGILISWTHSRLQLVSFKKSNFSLVPRAGLKAQAPRSDFCMNLPT